MKYDHWEICYAVGDKDSWSWELLEDYVGSYTDCLHYVDNDAAIGSGYAIFKNGVRILPDTREAKLELKKDRHERIDWALYYIELFRDMKSNDKYYDQQDFEIAQYDADHARALLDELNITMDETAWLKRKNRYRMHIELDNLQPMRFIERHPSPMYPEELPF